MEHRVRTRVKTPHRMRSPVAFPFAAPRTLAVLVIGASLGGLPRVARSQTTVPAPVPVPENAPLAPNAAPQSQDTPDGNQTVQTAGALGAYAQSPMRANVAGRYQTQQMGAEARMRDMMARNGITATTTQDAILSFLRDDEDNKRAVREASKRLWNGMRRDVPIERLRALMGDYQKALATAHENRVRAQTALDARVGYSLDARLEAMLWLLGVLGEGQNVIVVNSPAPPPVPVPIPTLPENGTRFPGGMMGRPRIMMVVPPTGEVQVEGVVSGKNLPEEAASWLEIRDDKGRLWRMAPSNNPDALPILKRQIGGLDVGARVLVRLVSPAVVAPNTPYTLLALSVVAQADRDGEDGTKGANPAPDGQ